MTTDDDLDPEQGEDDHHVPADLLELYEVLEWEAALKADDTSVKAALSAVDVAIHARNGGWSNLEDIATATAIAKAESGWNPRAHNPVPPDDSYGLWQINMLGAMGPERRRQFGISNNTELFDPAVNGRAAYTIFKSQGWRAWSVFKSGAYLKFMPEARTAAQSAVGKGDASKIVHRSQWGARPPRAVTALHNPQGVTWHYEGPRMGQFPHSSCATKVRGIQNFHMNTRGWTDVAYNMIVCPHGYIYVCRGRDVRSAANGTNTGNSMSHAICALIGDGDPVTDELLIGLLDARQWLIDGGTGHRTWGHRNWKATACPGAPIYRWFVEGMRRPGGTVTPPAPPPPPVDPGTPRCQETHPLLRRGSTGRPVNHLQYLLQRSGSKIAGDGVFGPATEAALRSAQSFMQITSDGVCGPQTWTHLHRHIDGLTI